MQPFIRILLRIAVAVGILLLTVGTAHVFLPKYRQMCGLDNVCRGKRGQVEDKQRNIHLIRENQGRLLSDPEFVARIAHQNRRVFPNELVFVFDDK